MFRKFIFPILVLTLAVLACNIQTATPILTPLVITDTSTPPVPTDTPLPMASCFSIFARTTASGASA